jgi:hypothetical protein
MRQEWLTRGMDTWSVIVRKHTYRGDCQPLIIDDDFIDNLVQQKSVKGKLRGSWKTIRFNHNSLYKGGNIWYFIGWGLKISSL